MKTMAKRGLSLAALGAFAIGCSHTIPPELADARTAYARAAQSPGAPLVPGDIQDARTSLNEAERTFSDSGDDQKTRDLAYIAQRRAVSAGAKAGTARAMQEKQLALADLEQARRAHAIAEASELQQTKSALSQSQQRAESERQARIDAEQRAQDMLSKIRDLKTERSDRGLVLTISGSVLFATGKSQLLASAQQRLKAVATALKDDPRPILIVGHTDSTGKLDLNQRLSEARADSVKKFLVQQGVSDDKVQTMGMGPSEPIASNATPEGRANNRRVEIVLQDQNKSNNGNGSPNPNGMNAPPPSGGSQTNPNMR